MSTPNTAETDKELRPALSQALDSLFGAGAYKLQAESDAGECYGFAITATHAQSLDALIGRLR